MLRVWDEYIADWLRASSSPPLPAVLQEWKDSYDGTGEGKVTEEAMPEPFIGDWFGAKRVTLGLNPGAADPLQSRGGCFAEQVARSSFSEWAKTDPYGGELWEADSTVNPAGRDGRHVNRYRAAVCLRPELAQGLERRGPRGPHGGALPLALAPCHRAH